MSLHRVSTICGKSNPSSSGTGLSGGIKLLNVSRVNPEKGIFEFLEIIPSSEVISVKPIKKTLQEE